IIVACLIIAVGGITSLARMPVDMFPSMNIPVVVVATFYSGMPPEQIETDITSRFERFFTLGSGIEHIESRSLPGVSVIKVYFQPGPNPDSAVTPISNLAVAQLRRLPPGTLRPVVLKFDASSLPVCLVTFRCAGREEGGAPLRVRAEECLPPAYRARADRGVCGVETRAADLLPKAGGALVGRRLGRIGRGVSGVAGYKPFPGQAAAPGGNGI